MAQTAPSAHTIVGVWKGSFYVDSTKMTYDYELAIREEEGKLIGYSKLVFEDGRKNKQSVYRDHIVEINGNAVVVTDKNVLAKLSSINQSNEVIKTTLFTLFVQDTSLELSGSWTTKKTRHFMAASGTTSLSKARPQETSIVAKLQKAGIADAIAFNPPPADDEQNRMLANSYLQPVKHQATGRLAQQPLLAKPNAAGITGLFSNPTPEPEPDMLLARKYITPAKQSVLLKKAIEPSITFRKKERIVNLYSNPLPQPVADMTVATNPKPLPAAAPKADVIKDIAKTEQISPATAPQSSVKILPAAKPATITNPSLALNTDLKNVAREVMNRTATELAPIAYKSDSLQITLYDNGEIDGDTVSVLLNNKVIIARQGLNTKPNVFTISTKEFAGTEFTLTMYAENLGSIPPNTGLMVIKDGRKVYEVRFSADLKTNAVIRLRRSTEEAYAKQ